MPTGKINVVACIDLYGAIGRGGDLPWPKIPADMKRFRDLTRGGTLVMGRKTWESIPVPIAHRKVAVLCSEGAKLKFEPDVRLHAAGASGLHGALAFAGACGAIEGDVWVCGGSRIYEEALDFADRVYLTVLNGQFRADAYWPLWKLDPALQDASSPDEVILPHWRAIRDPEDLETPFGISAYTLDLERI